MNMTAVAIVAIVCWALVAITTDRRDKKKNKPHQPDKQLLREVDDLKARVEVLEKIVTDEKYDLNKQFDQLEKDKVA